MVKNYSIAWIISLCLSIDQLKESWVVSTFWLLWLMLLWTFMYTVLCAQMFSFLQGPGVESPGRSPFYMVKVYTYLRQAGFECSEHWNMSWEVMVQAMFSGYCRTLARGTEALESMPTALGGTCMPTSFLGKEPRVSLTLSWGEMVVLTQQRAWKVQGVGICPGLAPWPGALLLGGRKTLPSCCDQHHLSTCT